MKQVVSRNLEVRAGQSLCGSVARGQSWGQTLQIPGVCWLAPDLCLPLHSLELPRSFCRGFVPHLVPGGPDFHLASNTTINCCCWSDLTCLCQLVSKQESLQPFCSPFMWFAFFPAQKRVLCSSGAGWSDIRGVLYQGLLQVFTALFIWPIFSLQPNKILRKCLNRNSPSGSVAEWIPAAELPQWAQRGWCCSPGQPGHDLLFSHFNIPGNGKKMQHKCCEKQWLQVCNSFKGLRSGRKQQKTGAKVKCKCL